MTVDDWYNMCQNIACEASLGLHVVMRGRSVSTGSCYVCYSVVDTVLHGVPRHSVSC